MTNYDTFYGGIVYVYTNSSIEFWVPSLHGNIIYVDNLWGNGEYSYNDETGRIMVKQFGFRQYGEILFVHFLLSCGLMCVFFYFFLLLLDIFMLKMNRCGMSDNETTLIPSHIYKNEPL